MRQRCVIAVDGPAGAGKGTVCRAAAAHFGLAYLDTGSLYRAVGLLALRRGLADPAEVARAAEAMDYTFRVDDRGHYRAFLEGEEVSAELRREEVGQAASRVSAIPAVRQALLGFQRRYGGEENAILDGRDVGTVVFPDADLKLYLEASLEERARRRAEELQAKGEFVNFDKLKADMAERDARDAERAHAPMKPAPDAVVVDTTRLSLADSIGTVVHEIQTRLRLPGKHQPQE